LQVDTVSLTKNRFLSFYSGSELVVAGRLRPATPGEELRYEIHGRSQTGLTHFEPQDPPVVIDYQPLDRDSSGRIERLWAYLSVQQLLDRADASRDEDSAFKRDALLLALKASQC
jgi:hypothetical protein